MQLSISWSIQAGSCISRELKVRATDSSTSSWRVRVTYRHESESESESESVTEVNIVGGAVPTTSVLFNDPCH